MAESLHRQIRVARRLSTLLLIGAMLVGPHAVAAALARGTSIIVFVDFSGSIRGPERASYRLELEREILPALRPGDRIIVPLIHDRNLTGVCVYVSGASAATAQLVAEIARFWDAYFRRARADFDPSRYAPMLLHWPPSRGCAANQFFKP